METTLTIDSEGFEFKHKDMSIEVLHPTDDIKRHVYLSHIRKHMDQYFLGETEQEPKPEAMTQKKPTPSPSPRKSQNPGYTTRCRPGMKKKKQRKTREKN